VRKDGSVFDKFILLVAAYDEQQQFTGHHCFMNDITDKKQLEAKRKRAEAELRNSEARYRLLFESNPNPIWVFDRETLAFLAVNPAAVQHYGYSQTEFLKMTVLDLCPVEELFTLQSVLQDFSSKQTYSGTWQHRRRDGSVIDVEIRAHPFALGDRPVCLVWVNDITERLKAERQIRQQAALLDIASDAIFVRDFQHRILYCNGQALCGERLAAMHS
jgi:two-component system cell cycle sensor histidine kinase/response regulator CckA